MRPLRWRRYIPSAFASQAERRPPRRLPPMRGRRICRTYTYGCTRPGGLGRKRDGTGGPVVAGGNGIHPHRRLCWCWPKWGSVVARTGPRPVGRVAKRCGCQSMGVLFEQVRGARGLDKAPSSHSPQQRALCQAHQCTRADKWYRQIKKRQDTGARRATRRGGAGGSQPAASVGRCCQTPHPSRGSPTQQSGANGRGGTPRGVVAGGSHRPPRPTVSPSPPHPPKGEPWVTTQIGVGHHRRGATRPTSLPAGVRNTHLPPPSTHTIHGIIDQARHYPASRHTHTHARTRPPLQKQAAATSSDRASLPCLLPLPTAAPAAWPPG